MEDNAVHLCDGETGEILAAVREEDGVCYAQAHGNGNVFLFRDGALLCEARTEGGFRKELLSGDGVVLCTEHFAEYIEPLEMAIDLIKSAHVEEWRNYLIARLAVKTHMEGGAFTLLCGRYDMEKGSSYEL